MVDVLNNLRDTLRSTAQQAWEGEESARRALEQTLDDHSDDIEDCFDVPDTQACLEGIFDAFEIDEDLEGDWDATEFADIITDLRDIQANWGADARDAVRQVAENNNLNQLHRWCTTGRVSDVAEEIDASDFSSELQAEFGFSSPSTARQCLQAVALIQDVRSDLQEAWETAPT